MSMANDMVAEAMEDNPDEHTHTIICAECRAVREVKGGLSNKLAVKCEGCGKVCKYVRSLGKRRHLYRPRVWGK